MANSEWGTLLAIFRLALGYSPFATRYSRSDGAACSISVGTTAASFELRSVSDVLTLRTCGAAVSSVTKAWNVLRSGATHLRMKSISPDSIQHSRTSG